MDLNQLNDSQISQKYRRRFALGVLALILLAFPAARYSFPAIHGLFNRPSDWIPADMPVRVDFDDFARRFAVTDLVLLSWDGADIASEELAVVSRLLAPLSEQDGTPEQSSTVSAATESDWELNAAASKRIQDCLNEVGTPPLHWARSGDDLLSRMTSAPLNLPPSVAVKRLTGSVIGPDGKQTCMVLSLNEVGSTHRRLVFTALQDAIALQLRRDRSEIALAGGPFDGASIDSASIRSVQAFSPPSAVVAGILCFICLRSLVLTLVVTVIAVIGEGLVLAAVYWSGSPMNAVLIVLPPLTFVLTVSSGIHLCNYYLDALHEFPKATRAQAAAIAMRAGTMPCLLACSTTVIGLGSLLLVRLEPIQVFGGVATLGLLATLSLLLMILPGAMMAYGGPRIVSDKQLLEGQPQDQHARSWVAKQIRWFLRMCLNHSTITIVFFLVSSALMTIGLTRLNTSVNLPRMFDADHPLRLQYAWFEEHLGPTINGELLLRFPAAQLHSDAIDRLDLVMASHLAVAKSEQVGGVLSAVSFLPSVPKGRGVSAAATRSVIRSQLTDPKSALATLGYLSRDEIAEVWRISFRLPMSTKSDYGPEIKAIGANVEAAVQAALANKASDFSAPQVVLTGGVKIAQEAQEVLLRDLFSSFMSAFVVVGIVMMFLLRSMIGGLIAMIPNLFPTIWLFGYMGAIEMPLDIGCVMTASVALGIAVDDTIHLLSRFGSRRARGIGRKRAAWGALQQCGMAMVHTTMVCGVSLFVYSLSDFVPTRRFAYLMFGLLGIALLGDLILLPALMVSRWGRYLARPVSADPGAELTAKVEVRPPDVRRLPLLGSKKTKRF